TLKFKGDYTTDANSQFEFNIELTTTDQNVGTGTNLSFTEPYQFTINRAPVVFGDFYQLTDEDASTAITGSIETFDDDGDSVTVTIDGAVNGSKQGTYGSLSYDSQSQQWAYTVDSNDTDTAALSVFDWGFETFQITANDGLNTNQETIHVFVEGKNDAPTGVTLASTSIAENRVGGEVGQLTVLDVDGFDFHDFTLSGTDAAFFEIRDEGALTADYRLKFKDGLGADFETKSSYDFNIQVEDLVDAKSVAQAVTISVTDVQESPTAIVLDSQSVIENSAGSVVGNLTVSDPDAADNSPNDGPTLTLEGSDAANFEIVANQLKFRAGQSGDFEAKPFYNLTVVAQDQGGNTYKQPVTVAIENKNEVVTAINLSSSQIVENSSGGVVGSIAIADPDAGDTHTLTLSGTDAGSFEIKDGLLKLKDNQSADFETKASYSLSLTATDLDGSGLPFTSALTIGVTNINEAPTAIKISNKISDLSIDEYQAGIAVGAVMVIDSDQNDTPTLALSGVDADSFIIDNSVLKLKDTVTADYITQNSYSVTLTATDTGDNVLSQDFVIQVNDVNKAPSDIVFYKLDAAETVIPLTTLTISENNPGGVISRLKVDDQDPGDSHTITFKGDDKDYFEVVNGNLKFKNSHGANFEDKASYSLEIIATDSGGLTRDETHTISVLDINEAPTAVTVANQQVVAENVKGAQIGTVSISDPDANETHTLTLLNSTDLFEINGHVLSFKSDVAADYEVQNSYQFSIKVEDKGNNQITEEIVVTISDVNEAPVITGTSVTQVLQDQPYAFQALAVDQDAGSRLTFSIENKPSWAIFDVKTGLLSGLPDNNNVGIYQNIKVTVSDGHLEDSLPVFSLAVKNVNDAPTVFQSLGQQSVNEDALLTLTTAGVFKDIDED
ncbi:MAG: hypothetical protein HN572_08860, partial [Kordiimonadaceae bacterium]|nr:hypothetical protein [Kordiimonadaceae bacterium]